MKGDGMNNFPRLPFKQYIEIRDQIHSGDILLCSGNYVFSGLARQASEPCWSHVAFVLRLDSIDWIMVLESIVGKGIRIIPLSEYVKNYEGNGRGYQGRLALARYAELAQKVTPEALKRVFKFAVDSSFVPHHEHVAARTTDRIPGFNKNDILRKQAYSSSEYVYKCFRMLGIDVCFDDRCFDSPASLAGNASLELLWELETE